MSWETKRKLLYGVIILISFSACAIFLLRDTLFPTPTCSDNKQNGYELGVDCGGTCLLRCSQEVNPLTVVWAKAIMSEKGIYDLVALVSNTNIDNASREVGFMFSIYNKDGKLTGSLFGSTTVPLDGKFPLIIQNVPMKEDPSTVVVTLSDGPHYKVNESPTSPTVKVVDRYYEKEPISRVHATVINTKHIEILNLPVRTLLYDENNNVYAVGQTVIPVLPKEGVKEIVFTWNERLPYAPTRIEVYPIFNPFDSISY